MSAFSPLDQSMNGMESSGQMGLAEILQMCCMAKRTGVISFYSGEKQGAVYLQHGLVLHALTSTYEGEAACFDMLQWPAGNFQFDDGVLPDKRTVTLTWEQILFEGARRIDEGLAPDAVSPGETVGNERVKVTRIQGGVPKLTIIEGELPPATYEIEKEYTRVGRAPDNDISLPIPAVSGRHCMVCLNGPDVILRDLNSSNGTFVNGEQVSETILQLGDIIQVGSVVLKFESGVKRPKISRTTVALGEVATGTRSKPASAPAVERSLLTKSTDRLPKGVVNASAASPSSTQEINRSYVTGGRAISFDDLRKPEGAKKNLLPLILLVVGVLSAVGIAVYYFLYVA